MWAKGTRGAFSQAGIVHGCASSGFRCEVTGLGPWLHGAPRCLGRKELFNCKIFIRFLIKLAWARLIRTYMSGPYITRLMVLEMPGCWGGPIGHNHRLG